MEDRIINRGKDWFAFTKSMADYMVKPIPRKLRGEPKTKGITNDTRQAQHSPTKNTTRMRL
jgi:hypothetical protein